MGTEGLGCLEVEPDQVRLQIPPIRAASQTTSLGPVGKRGSDVKVARLLIEPVRTCSPADWHPSNVYYCCYRLF